MSPDFAIISIDGTTEISLQAKLLRIETQMNMPPIG